MMDFLLAVMNPERLQGLAFASLFLLLLGVGLELEPKAVRKALAGAPYPTILIVNFLWIPMLCVALIQWLGIPAPTGWAMVILAVSPFAPVVPLFVRMARGNLPLAAGMTALFPLFSAFLTPLSLSLCQFLIDPQQQALAIAPRLILELLFMSITLPLLLGMIVHRHLGQRMRWLVRGVNGLAEITGVLSLIALTLTEWSHLQTLTLQEIMAMILAYELAYAMGGHALSMRSSNRIALGLGAANRNIGLAVLIALRFFTHDPVLAPLVGNSLLMILLGLCHAGLGHLRWRRQPTSTPSPQSLMP